MPKYLDENGLSTLWGKITDKISNKQDKLVRGTNIKTINGNSLLGSGNITINTSGTIDSALSTTSTNPVQNKVINSALSNKQDKLVSGTNIKTIDGTSLLGSGSISFKNVNGISVIGSGNLNSMILIPNECNTITSSNIRHASYSFKLYNDGLSIHIRQGTISVSGTSFNASNTDQKITFSRKMPNSNYSLILTVKINNSTSREVYTTIYSKTAADFSFNAHISNKSYKITEIDYVAILIN